MNIKSNNRDVVDDPLLDKEAIQKTVLKKLSKRSKLLKKAIKPGQYKIYKLNYRRPKKGREFDPDTREVTGDRGANRRSNSRIDYVPEYKECMQCQQISGIYIYSPFYREDYLNSFYNQLESAYYNNRADRMYISHLDNTALMFDRQNLYQVLEYSYLLNPTLGAYLFRFLVDMVYLLRVPESEVKNFYLNSMLTVVRYERSYRSQSQTDSLIRRTTGPVIVMPLGPDVGVYDLISPMDPRNALRFFFKKGSIMIIDIIAKNTWTFGAPADYIDQSSQYRYEIMLYPYVYGVGYNFNY